MEQNFSYFKEFFGLPADAPPEDILAKLQEASKAQQEPWLTLLSGEILGELKRQGEAKAAYKATNKLVRSRIAGRLAAVSSAIKKLDISLKRQFIIASVAALLTISLPMALFYLHKRLESGLTIKENRYTLTLKRAANELDGLNFARWLWETESMMNGGQNNSDKPGHLSFQLGGGGEAAGDKHGGANDFYGHSGALHGAGGQSSGGGSGQGNALGEMASAEGGLSNHEASNSAQEMAGGSIPYGQDSELAKGPMAPDLEHDPLNGSSHNIASQDDNGPIAAVSNPDSALGRTAAANDGRGDMLKFTKYHTIAPPFTCQEVELLCTKEEVPTTNSPWRIQLMDLFHLDNIYFSYSDDCQTMSRDIETFTTRYGWHKPEREVKCDVEARVALCYYKANTYPEAAEHARRAICSGLSEALPAMNILATIAKKNGDKALVKRYITCMDRFTAYYDSNISTNAYTVYNHLSTGVYSWELNNDLKALIHHTAMAEKLLPKATKTVFLDMVSGMVKFNKMMISAIKGDSDAQFYPLMHASMNTPWNDERDILHTHIYNFTRLMLRRNHEEAKKSFAQVLTRYCDMAEYDEKEPFIGLSSLVKNSPALSKEESQQLGSFFQILDGKKDHKKVEQIEKIAQFINSL